MSEIHPDSHIRQVEEIKIPVPYGHLAAKWWGRRDVRPIVCLHGWQDNAGTFDTLIPRLPEHVGYLAIDMPGHGLSSRLPNGLTYTAMDDMYVLNYVIRQFGWPKVSLLAHSAGAILSFIFAATFPERVDLVIALDSLQPRVLGPQHTSFLLPALELTRQADMRNITASTEPPAYTFDELVDRMNSRSFLSVSRSSALYLLARGVAESSTQPDRYYFTRDNRLKTMHFAMRTQEINESMAKSIECPLLFIKALQSPDFDSKETRDAILELMLEKPLFEMHTVDGEHHVHLNQPDLVSGAVSAFLLKHEHSRTASDVEKPLAKL